MTKNKLKQKCTERVKIFQQAMESCHSSSPMDCIEWFADRIANLEKRIAELEQENAELIQENEEMKKGLGCETCQIHLEYMRLNNKIADLEKENAELKAGRDINVFTKQLTKAKEIISEYINILNGDTKNWKKTQEKAEQFLNGENIILEDAQVGNSPFDADEVFNKEMKAYPEQFFKD